MADEDVGVVARALVILTQFGVPSDIQELLVRGNPTLSVKPGARAAAISADPQAQSLEAGIQRAEETK